MEAKVGDRVRNRTHSGQMLTFLCRAVQRAFLLLGPAPGFQLCRVSALLLMISKAARVHLNASHLYPRLPVNHLEA